MSAVPDTPDAVVGWRTWSVGRTKAGAPELVSAFRRSVWPPRETTVAMCAVHGHAPPAVGCECGLYAVVEPRYVTLKWGDHRSVLGCAALWGDVVDAAHGWRASLGHPRLLIADPRLGRWTRARLAHRYGIEVHASRWPLEYLVELFGTPLREQADGLSSGAVRWPDLADAVDRQVRRDLAERHESRARGTVPRPEAILSALGTFVSLGVVPLILGFVFWGFVIEGIREAEASKILDLVAVPIIVLILFALPVWYIVTRTGDLCWEVCVDRRIPLPFVDHFLVSRLSRSVGALVMVQALLGGLLGWQGWQPWSWVIVAVPIIVTGLYLSTVVPTRPSPPAHSE